MQRKELEISLEKNNLQILKYCSKNQTKNEKNYNTEVDVIKVKQVESGTKDPLLGQSLTSILSTEPNNPPKQRNLEKQKTSENELNELNGLKKISEDQEANFSPNPNIHIHGIETISPFTKSASKKHLISSKNENKNKYKASCTSDIKGFRPLMTSLDRQILGGLFNFETVGLNHDLIISKEDIPLLLSIYKTTVDLKIGNVPKQKYPQETLKFKEALAKEKISGVGFPRSQIF